MGRVFLRFLNKAKRWVRYIYFLRFSLALWLFAPLMCALDRTSAKTLTSGVMTPETFPQYLCVAFFLISAGFVALICARVVLINGPERWDKCYDGGDDGRPPGLKALLAIDQDKNEWWALLLSQLPNVGVYLYLVVNGTGQEVHAIDIWLGLISGSTLALVVWWMVNAWYYLTYDAPDPTGVVEFGRNAARTLVFPRNFLGFGLHRLGTDQYSHDTIEGASTWLEGRVVDTSLRWIAERLYGTPGYAYRRRSAPTGSKSAESWTADAQADTPNASDPPSGAVPAPSLAAPLSPPSRLYEGHVFGGLSAIVYTSLYCLLWPLTAPVPAIYSSIAALGLLFIFCAIFIWVISKTPGHSYWKLGLAAVVAAVFLSFISIFIFSSPERFPIFAIFLIIATALCWILSGVSFFLDLYRVPVLTVFLLAMVLPRWLPAMTPSWMHSDKGREEHYLSTITGPQLFSPQVEQNALPEPKEILDAARAANPDQAPLIVVTATGGGLHASAWTTEVLAHLEQQFDQKYPDAKGTFHKHLLLASTVSGGSIGLLNYLAALHQKTPGESLDYQSMLSTAQCSSLEAVGWGLVYWDMSKAIVPVVPYFWKPSSGLDDLDPTPLGKDRTWSLRKSFARNVNNDYCKETWRRDNGPYFTTLQEWLSDNLKNRLATNMNDEARNQAIERQLTLRNLQPAWGDRPIPAFTMNTTGYEDGERFLLANYKIPDPQPNAADWPDTRPSYKARSFLATYNLARLSDGKTALADLPLATAAQMSATFPYISSAARVPLALDPGVNAVHFVDGGYYDNDGTASVIEFLRYALARCQNPIPGSDKDACEEKVQGEQPKAAQAHPVRILLIEIRNSGDDYGSEPESNPYHTSAKKPLNLFDQFGTPLIAFWQAGHESVTARTRVALAQLEHALSDRLELHRVVFADSQSTNEVGTDPLSWSLTPKQRREVRTSATGCVYRISAICCKKYNEALEWFRKSPEDWAKDHKHYADSDWPE